MSSLIIQIDLDNDAFQGPFGAGAEAARILRNYADIINDFGIDSRSLRDINGNSVGIAYIEEDQ